MTAKVVPTDEQLGRFSRQLHDWYERYRKGSLDADVVVHAVQRVIDKFPVWRTIRIGTPNLRTADDCRCVLGEAVCRISGWANSMLDRCLFASKETDLDLVVVSVAELGFDKGATRVDIYTRAQELGLDICPADVGPALRLAYKDQPQNEWLLVAMEPIADSDGNLFVWYVVHDNVGLWLSSGCGDPGSFWNARYRVVFVRRK
jgi:hypothetical protein